MSETLLRATASLSCLVMLAGCGERAPTASEGSAATAPNGAAGAAPNGAAADTADGHTVWDYEIDVKAPGMTMPMAPIAADGRVFIGNAGGDQAGVTGHVYALDADDGHVVWRFDTVPDSDAARAT